MSAPHETARCAASANQKRMYVLNRLSPEGTEYNIPVALRLRGLLDVRRLRRSLAALVARHTTLRTSFEIAEKGLAAVVHERVRVPLLRRTARCSTDVESIKREFVRPFDLRRAPLLRACLIRCEDEHVLLLDLHHIICDGASIDILVEDLAGLYGGRALDTPARDYTDFAIWQERFAATPAARQQEEYWLDLLNGDRPSLTLPTDFPRRALRSFAGDRVFRAVPRDLTIALRALAAKNRVSMYMLLLAAYYVLLSKYAGQDDIVVGTLVDGRQAERFQGIVGLFVNTLALRSRPRGELTFVEFLKQVRGDCLSAFENQDYQFEDLVDRIAPARDLGRNPLFDTMFTALAQDGSVRCCGGIEFSRYELEYEIAKFDFSLTSIERQDRELQLEFEYCTDLFHQSTIERLAADYLAVLNAIVATPSVPLSDISLLTAEERRRLMPVGGDCDEPRAPVVELFIDQARKHPEAPAVSSGDVTVSYGELHRQSNAIAARLQAQGVGRGDLVGLLATPSLEAIAGLLGVLKIGGAYLPLDPSMPVDRIRAIVADSRVTTLLVQRQSQHLAPEGPTTTLLDEAMGGRDDVPAGVDVGPHDLAYVIYTSGSTGTPKGVMVSHGALANYVNWATRTYIGDAAISFALHSPLSVDLTVTSVFTPLVSGNRIVIYHGDDGIGVLERIVADNEVDLVKLTPTHLSLLAEVVKDRDPRTSRLRRIIVGGEDLKTSVAARIDASFGGRVEIFNEYGPTEATVGCTVHLFRPDATPMRSVPIGRPIANTSVFVLDSAGHPVPARVIGELFIAGACLADGYLNSPQQTDQRFVVKDVGPITVRMYRTGDLARMLPNGDLEYLGRNDDQVKIRGYRIELGEVEASLLRLLDVREAAVTKRLDSAGNAYLCAYVVADRRFSAPAARTCLADHLPSAMVPERIVRLDRFPTGRGGKLDKYALPDPDDLVTTARPYVPPTSRAEAGLVRIWEQVLAVPRIGIDDNFFDLGGQSLKATVMIARANRELHVNLALRDLFTHPTVRALAATVVEAKEELWPAIEPVGEQEHYPASSAQKRLFILHQLAPTDVQYNVPFAIEIAGTFDRERWQGAFRSLIARHESLRTSFALVDDEIVQKVATRVAFAFEPLEGAATLQQTIETFVRPFDLSEAPLMRVAAVASGPSTHALIADMHHIVSDGLSIEIMLDELGALYRGEALEPVATQYKDYAAWQRACSATDAVRAQGAYWRNLFSGELPVLSLPTDFSRGAVQSFDGDLVRFRVEPATVARLAMVARECGATMYMTLLAVYTVLLSKYAGQDDIVVGTPVAGRPHASLQKVVGMFVNTVPMRNQPRPELGFAEFLRTVRNHALDAFSNQDYQFEELVDALQIERNLSRNPLFDTVFAFGSERRPVRAAGVGITAVDFDWKVSKFDLTLLAAEREDGIDFEIEYCTRLFRRGTMERFAAHYQRLLEQVASNPELRIRDLDPLTESEREQVLVAFNRTDRSYPAACSIHALLEAQVDQTPEQPALVFRDRSLSYARLDQRANQVARRLLQEGVAREEVVAIVAAPSFEMIVGILAILKAGGAYLPIDPDCPDDRARAMLDDSGARIVLSAGATWRADSRLLLDLNDESLYDGDDSRPAIAVGGRDLAYVIYTSGTTGVPKGVMIEHHAVNNLCAWHNETFHVTAADRATKYARFSFDASVWEIFPYLQAGATLHLIEERIRLDLPELNRYFENHGITISFLPTQICELFMELENSSLRVLLTGGDRLRRFRPKRYLVVNNYGPTESTVVATTCTVSAEESRIPIGRPICNTRVYVVGAAGTVAPIGVPGELCLAGVGLARGYRNDATRTAEKFVPDPFDPGARMYRTGDLARWRADGALEYLGRSDDQVKIRGCRAEPREIEATILAHESVHDAVVVAREDKQGVSFLCAYVVWHEAPNADALRAFLSSRLPDYMLPAFIVTVERIPINARGKVDHSKLPNPDGSAAAHGYVPAATETERRLADIWRRVLDRERVGVHDNFFEIGGDSLRATIMLAKANREFGTAVPLGAVFDNPRIASLARCFEGVGHDESLVLQAVPRRPYYAVTPTQALLHALCVTRKGVEYNLPMAFHLHGHLDVERIEGVFGCLIARHEAFRTSFHTVSGRVVQTVSPAVDFAVELLPPCDADEIVDVAHDFIRPFDLSTPPLLRVGLVPMGPEHHVLLLDVHHLVSDGTSMGILFQEIAALYAGQDPPVRTTTFKDFAEWLPAHLDTPRVRDQARYWQNVLGEPPEPVRLDTDYPRPATFSFAGGRIDFTADQQIHRALKRLCAEEGVTLYMVLLAAYTALISKYSRKEDIVVGVPTVGRYLADVQDVIGMFVSTHAIRTKPQASLRFLDFLRQVKGDVRGALEHQEYQLWDLIIGHALRTGGKPLFNTVFVVQDQGFTTMAMPGLRVEEMDPGYHVAKFDLTFGAVERAEGLEFELEYSTDVFRRSTARRFARHYLNLLGQIAADPTRELRRLDMMPADEREHVLSLAHVGEPEFATDDTVIDVFERQAETLPGRVAVVCDGQAITYGELNRRANREARRLRSAGIAAGDVVALALGPSLDMIVAVLAVLKAGAAYLPLGADDPPKRTAHIVADSKAKLLLRRLQGDATDLDDSNLGLAHDARALAYVSYVADRAGRLTGVAIEHRSLRHRCGWYSDRFGVGPDDRSAKFGDLSASASIFEVFPLLCAGASVCIVPETARRAGSALTAWLEATGVTIAWLPAPSCASLSLADSSTLRLVLTAGHVTAIRKGAYELVRCFGAAEDTEVTACCSMESAETGAIVGKPIPGAQVFVIGHDECLLPIGVTGELCLAGAGRARGDIGDAAGARRFTSNPHVPGECMYRTGYPARWLHDGRLELTGRMDEVSLEGRRVSLSEIEHRLTSDPAIEDAAVLLDAEDPLRQRLVAFVVVRGALPMPPDAFVFALKLRLAEWLPGCMVPDTYIKVGMIPRTSDGRVQYDALPLHDDAGRRDPVSPAVDAVRSIAANLLQVTQVRTDANLLELGMNSLIAAQLVTRLADTFGVAPYICQVLTNPTPAAIAHSLEAGRVSW